MTDLQEPYKAKEKEVKELVAKKDSIEKEIDVLTDYLTVGAGSRFGLHGSLVDHSGFPDKDVELVLAVRQARNQLAMLKNDHKSIMATIQKELYNLHALAAERKQQESTVIANGPTDTINKKQEETTSQSPEGVGIARVASVADNSPAHSAGLQSDDIIISFGSIGPLTESETSSILPTIGRIVKDSENSTIHVVVIRDLKRVSLNLVPKRWAGNGLLGCLLTPL